LYAANRGRIEGDLLAYNTASRTESGDSRDHPWLAGFLKQFCREDLVRRSSTPTHIPPLAFGHIIPNGTYCSTAIFRLRTVARFSREPELQYRRG